MNGSLSDPLENLKSQRPNNPYTNQPIKGQQGQQRVQQQYNPSMYDQQSNKRGGGGKRAFIPPGLPNMSLYAITLYYMMTLMTDDSDDSDDSDD